MKIRMFSKILTMLREKRSLLFEYGFYLFVVVFILYLAPNFLMETIVVDGTSMQDSLQNGEQVSFGKVFIGVLLSGVTLLRVHSEV